MCTQAFTKRFKRLLYIVSFTLNAICFREEEEGEEEAIESDTACSLWEQKTKTKVREKRLLFTIYRLSLTIKKTIINEQKY